MPVCEYCRPHQTLDTENDMHKHVASEHPYRCTLCPDSLDFSSHFTWIYHYNSNHQKQCPYCDAIVGLDTRKKMIHFQQVHAYHPCTICLSCFEDEDELLAHYANPSIEYHPYVCNLCNKDLVYNQDFWHHWFNEHAQDEDMCPLCPEQVVGGLKNQLQWKEHLKSQHKLVPCVKCFEVFVNEYEGEMHYKDQHRIACPICQDHFPDEQSKAKHVSTNHRFTCPHCPNLSFPNHPLMQDHITLAHNFNNPPTPEPIHTCTYCPKTFPTDEQLLAHTNVVHKYLCTVCSQYLDHGETLRYHYEFVHRAQCDLCAKVCSSDKELVEHYSSVHGTGADRGYVCSVCREAYESERVLVEHYKEKHVMRWDVSPPPPLADRYSTGDYGRGKKF